MQVYGADKVWKQMNREGIAVARCTVESIYHWSRQAVLPRPVERARYVSIRYSERLAEAAIEQGPSQFVSGPGPAGSA